MLKHAVRTMEAYSACYTVTCQETCKMKGTICLCIGPWMANEFPRAYASYIAGTSMRRASGWGGQKKGMNDCHWIHPFLLWHNPLIPPPELPCNTACPAANIPPLLILGAPEVCPHAVASHLHWWLLCACQWLICSAFCHGSCRGPSADGTLVLSVVGTSWTGAWIAPTYCYLPTQ